MANKLLLSATTAALIFSGTALAAKNTNSLNGQPFQQLNNLIEQNAELIEQNSAAIETNAQSISELKTEISSINFKIDTLKTQVSANTASIKDAFEQIAATQGRIDNLQLDLNSFKRSVSSSIRTLTNEIKILKNNVNDLRSGLRNLQTNLSTSVANLNNAIENNSSEILVLSGIVSSLNADLTLANSEIIDLQGQINTLETEVEGQKNAYDILSQQILMLDTRVTAIENGANTSNINEITLTGTYGVQDYTIEELRDAFASLDYKSGEYLYIVGNNQNTFGTTEVCTADPKAYEAIQAFINNQYFNMQYVDADLSKSWMKGSNWYGVTSNDWETPTHFYAYATPTRNDFMMGSHTYFNISPMVITNSYQSNKYAANGVDHSDGSGMMFSRKSDLLVSNGTDAWSAGNAITATYRTGKNRQEVCGF